TVANILSADFLCAWIDQSIVFSSFVQKTMFARYSILVHAYDLPAVVDSIQNGEIPSTGIGQRWAKCPSVIEKTRCGGKRSKHSHHLAEIVDAENFRCCRARIIQLAKRLFLIHKTVCHSTGISKLPDHLTVVVNVIGRHLDATGYREHLDAEYTYFRSRHRFLLLGFCDCQELLRQLPRT